MLRHIVLQIIHNSTITLIITYLPTSMQADTQVIEINVRDPVLQQSGGFTSYMISGIDRHGAFEIRRRFNDFYLLREGLKKRFPGFYIPPVPEKKVIVKCEFMQGNKEEKLVEDRKRFLDYFCKQIAKTPYIFYSETFQLLIRSKGDLEKLIDAQQKPNAAAIIAAYRELIPQEFSKEKAAEARGKSNTFNGYLKKAEKQLKQLKDDVKEVADAKRSFNDHLNVCNTIMIPEYEKNVFAEYVNHNSEYLLFNSNPEISEKVNELKEACVVNSFDYVYDLVAVEYREVLAFQQAIESRQHIEEKMRKLVDKKRDDQAQLSKLMSGKTTFKSFFTKGNKEEQKRNYEKSLEEDQKEIDNLIVAIDLIAIYQGDIELPKFKATKQKQYYEILNLVARTEVKNLSIYGGLMKAILAANQNVKYE